MSFFDCVSSLTSPRNGLNLSKVVSDNPSFRQLLHVSFKVAAKKGDRYLNALKKHEAVIAKNVTENLFERHLKPLLLVK